MALFSRGHNGKLENASVVLFCVSVSLLNKLLPHNVSLCQRLFIVEATRIYIQVDKGEAKIITYSKQYAMSCLLNYGYKHKMNVCL